MLREPESSKAIRYKSIGIKEEIVLPNRALIFLEAQKNKNLCKGFSFPLLFCINFSIFTVKAEVETWERRYVNNDHGKKNH